MDLWAECLGLEKPLYLIKIQPKTDGGKLNEVPED